jgi:AraC family transcriptional regulator, positive regulator of tynA and feaB
MPTFSTDVVAENRRFEYWRELISNNLISVNIDQGSYGTFFGSLLTCEIGSSQLLHVSSTSQSVTRTGQGASEDRKNSYLLNYLADGHGSTSQHGNFHDLTAGDFFIHDSSSAGSLRLIGDFEMYTLSLTRALVDRYFARAQYLCSAPLSVQRSAEARVAADMLQSLATNCLQMRGESFEAVVESLVGIVGIAYESQDAPCRGASTPHTALLIRIRNYILDHLGDEDLSPSRIAADHRISGRYLSKLFENESTTVSKWIWIQRLEASRRALSLPEFANRKVNEVAYACGFNDMSHFSFSFRKRFGCTPRQHRASIADA